ncbi:MAG: type II toxin-antitoxin system VapC family toxin [Luteolibacter sp.]
MSSYADTGFLVALYKEESTSVAANEAIRDAPGPVLISPLVELEFRNAMHLAVFRNELARAEAAELLVMFIEDIRSGIYLVPAVPSAELHKKAFLLSDLYSADLGTRSLDLMHVASAVILGAETFLSFDSRQRAAAKAEGLEASP